jgi:hypothetical protein
MGLVEKLPPTVERVEQNTADEVNERIRREMEERVAHYGGASRETITARLRELDREWDIERVLEANASTVMLLGILLGFTVNKRWFAFSRVAAAFLLQHALHGWCPPVVPWRRSGVRTAAEIEAERTAIRLLAGDLQPTNDPTHAVAQATAR